MTQLILLGYNFSAVQQPEPSVLQAYNQARDGAGIPNGERGQGYFD